MARPATTLASAIIAAVFAGTASPPVGAGDGLSGTFGFDSLDRMELSLAIQQRFGFSGEAVPTTVSDLWVLAQGLAESAPPKPPRL